MAFATRGNLVWVGMILSGVALGSYVVASWPDTSPRVVRLPYGEVMPKTPRAAERAQQVEVVAAPATPEAELAVAQPAPAPAPVPVPERAPVSAPHVEEAVAPEESADELGAAPLPGTRQARPKPAAKKSAAATPAHQAPAAEPATEPQQAPEDPPTVEIIIGSAPPPSDPE